MNNGTFAHILQDESLFSNSSVSINAKLTFLPLINIKVSKFLQKFGHLIEGAGRTCDSKFHISGAEYLSSMFNPFKFVEIAVTEFCSINCMFNELKIVSNDKYSFTFDRHFEKLFSLIFRLTKMDLIVFLRPGCCTYITKLGLIPNKKMI